MRDNGTADNDGELPGPALAPYTPKTEIQNDFFDGAPVLSGDVPHGVSDDNDALPGTTGIGGMASALAGAQAWLTADTLSDDDGMAGSESAGMSLLSAASPVSSVAFANVGLEPVNDIWDIPALQDDTEHLQDMAYRLVFELAEAMGCETEVREDKRAGAAGFAASEHGGEFVLFLAGLSGQLPNRPFNMFLFCLNFFGSQSAGDTPVFDDVHVVKTLRLIRVIRRLRELQRAASTELYDGGPGYER